jgi:hypothetical protein
MSKDTTREAQRIRLEALSKLPAERRLLEALQLIQAVAELAALGAAARESKQATARK